jgi:hypothetical protein
LSVSEGIKNRVTAKPSPFTDAQIVIEYQLGDTIKNIIEKACGNIPEQCRTFVFIDDQLISPDDWEFICPLPSYPIAINIIPGNQNVVRAVAFIAIAVLAAYAGPVGAAALGYEAGTLGFSVASGVISTTVGVTGMMAINALIQPPVPARPESIGHSEAYRITGSRNILDKGGPITRVFGRHKIYPKYAALPYTETYGTDVYYRMLFMVGKEEYTLSDFKIGETALSSFDDYEIEEGYKDDVIGLYSNGNDIYEEAVGVQLTKAGGWHEVTTQVNTTEIIAIITLPAGIWCQYDSGRLRLGTAVLEAEYSIKDAGSWTPFPTSPWTIKGKWWSSWSGSWRVSGLSSNQYDVRIRRMTNDHPPYDSGKINQVDATYFASLQSISHDEEPFTLDDVTLIALRIKSSNQLNGILEAFSLIAQAKLPTYTESAGWSSVRTETRNPAWAYAEVLRNLPYGRSIDDNEINGDDLLEWATACDTAGFYYDKVIDFKTTVGRVLDEIAAAGRASRAWVDGKHTVIMDAVHSTYVQGFSPRNSWGYKGQRVFAEIPHALICRFVDETDDSYAWDELVVYDDGYSELGGSSSGTDAATVFEVMDFPGVTDPDHVWKLARYFLAVARLRPETHTINVDVENLVATRGQMVRFAYDTIKVGLYQARIKSIGTLGSELVTNGDMELDSNWNDVGSVDQEQSTEQVYAGYYSRKFIATTTLEGIRSDSFTTTTSQTYRHAFWIYSSTNSVFTLTIRKGDDSGSLYNTEHSITQNAWNYIEVDVTETAGGSSAYIAIHSGNETSGTWYVDNVSVKQVTDSNQVILDDYVVMEGGKTYAAQIRKADGTWLDTTVTLDGGEQNEIELASVSGIAVGDLLFFGESGSVTSDLLITSIKHSSDMTAKLTMVNYNAAILSADSGSIPAWNANITERPEIERIPPTCTMN